MIKKKNKVVILGAGPAGLTAGYELLSFPDSYEVVIIEESKDVGGISKTVDCRGNKMDLGGHRFFSKSSKVTDWWKKQLSVQGSPAHDDKVLGRTGNLSRFGPDPDLEDEVLLIRKRVSRIYYRGKFINYPLCLSWDTIRNIHLSDLVGGLLSYIKSLILKLEESNLENFYINRFGRHFYRIFFESYTEKLWGIHPSKLSADWGSQRIKGLSVKAIFRDIFSKLFLKNNIIKETSLIEEFYYPKFGPGQLWEKIATDIVNRGGKIIRNFKVIGIRNTEDKVLSVVCADGKDKTETIEGDIFVSSIPLSDLLLGMELVPRSITEVAKDLPYRSFITLGLLVNKLKISNRTNIPTLGNIIPDCWLYIQDKGVKLGRIQIFNNWSPYMVKDIDNTVWLGLEYFCDEGDDFWDTNDDELVEFARKELIKIGIIEERAVILDFRLEKVKKAYPAYYGGYYGLPDIRKYLDRYDNLYCIGRNGQHRYNNMDHSMLTAFETVRNIVNGEKKKDNIWNVNSESDYHEVVDEKSY